MNEVFCWSDKHYKKVQPNWTYSNSDDIILLVHRKIVVRK